MTWDLDDQTKSSLIVYDTHDRRWPGWKESALS